MYAKSASINPNFCCFVDPETRCQCQSRATFWIGTDGVDHTHSCEEHVKDLRCKGDVVRAFASSGPSIASIDGMKQNLKSYAEQLRAESAGSADGSATIKHYFPLELANAIDAVLAIATCGPVQDKSVVCSILRNDQIFKAIMQEAEYANVEKFKYLFGVAKHENVRERDIFQAERSLLVNFVDMLMMYGYTITRTPVYNAEGTKQIGVDMAAVDGDHSAYAVWYQNEVRKSEERMAKARRNDKTGKHGPCYREIDGRSVHNPREGDSGPCVCGERTVVPAATGTDNRWIEIVEQTMGGCKPSHFKHALTVEELIDAPKIEIDPAAASSFMIDKGISFETLSDDEATFMNKMADAVEQTTCTCKSLINGHSNGCPFAPK